MSVAPRAVTVDGNEAAAAIAYQAADARLHEQRGRRRAPRRSERANYLKVLRSYALRPWRGGHISGA